MKKAVNLIGLIVGVLSLILAFCWFGWQLPVVIFLAIWGNNLERIK